MLYCCIITLEQYLFKFALAFIGKFFENQERTCPIFYECLIKKHLSTLLLQFLINLLTKSYKVRQTAEIKVNVKVPTFSTQILRVYVSHQQTHTMVDLCTKGSSWLSYILFNTEEQRCLNLQKMANEFKIYQCVSK